MKVAFFSAQSYEVPFYTACVAHQFHFIDERLSSDTAHLANGYDAICAFITDELSELVLSKLAGCGVRLVALRSAGYDQVDLYAAQSLGLVVTHVPYYSPESIAEFALTLLLSVLRRLPLLIERQRTLDFRLNGAIGRVLTGSSIGIVGLGRIGCAFARCLQGFDCDVMGYDPIQSPEFLALGGRSVPLETIWRDADIISLHCPSNEDTHHLLDQSAFSQMKSGVILVNTARGDVIDTAALLDALHKGVVGAVGLDVIEGEKAIFGHTNTTIESDQIAQLMADERVVLMPHAAFFTDTALASIAEQIIGTLSSFERGEIIHAVTAH